MCVCLCVLFGRLCVRVCCVYVVVCSCVVGCLYVMLCVRLLVCSVICV